MDLKLRTLERAYLMEPSIATLLPYANETIRMGVYSVETQMVGSGNTSYLQDTLRDANGKILDVDFHCRPVEMLVMRHIETVRRHANGTYWLCNPGSVALWMSCDGFEPNAAWVYNGLVLG